MSQGSLQLLHSLALGFAISGLLVAIYRALAAKPASFRLMQGGGVVAVLAVPFLAFDLMVSTEGAPDVAAPSDRVLIAQHVGS